MRPFDERKGQPMPIRTDATGNRWVEMEFVAPGSPEEVWQAMATGPGNATWFTRATIEERVGGVMKFEFGPDMSSSGEVTAWQPPHRFGYVERDWLEGAPPVATEITITRRSERECTVRMVHTLVSTSDVWDAHMEGFQGGWPAFFEVLRLYLKHFAGKDGAPFQAMTRGLAGDDLPVWTRLIAELGLSGANVGERRATASKPEAVAGVVEHVLQSDRTRFLLMRLDAPGPGIVIVGTHRGPDGVHASVTRFFYGDDAAATASASESLWRTWLLETFSSAGPSA